MIQSDDLRPEITSVNIYGTEYPLSSGESTGYTQKIAEFVDHKMTQIASEENLANLTKVAIMAAMDIAEKLLKQKEKGRLERRRAVKALDRLGRYLDEASGRTHGV